MEILARRWPLVLLILGAVLGPGEAAADDVRIRIAVANVRASGSAQGRVLFQVKAGEVLRLIETAGDWLHVETSDGRRGYVAKSLVEVIAAAPSTRAAAPPAPAPASGGTLAIDHKDVACIVGDRYPRLDACFLPAGELGNAKVNFRAGDKGPWYAVDLLPDGACHIAYLPKPLATTTEIQYYVAAVDRAFNERQQPETAPDTAYRARVVRNQGDCDRMKRVAASVTSTARPILVSAARTGGSPPVALGTLLVGFSQEGVILASAAAAGTGGAAVAGTGAGAGSGGGIGTGTLAIAGGVVAAGALVAVAAGGGDEEETPSCNVSDIVAGSQGTLVAVDGQSVCSVDVVPCSGGRTLRFCVSGLCQNTCSGFYQLSDNQRFTCAPLPNCSATGSTGDPSFCLAAAQQAAFACQ